MTHKEFENWMNSVSYTEWMEWAKKPSENRNGRKNILPEIVEYLSDHPEEFCNVYDDSKQNFSVPEFLPFFLIFFELNPYNIESYYKNILV